MLTRKEAKSYYRYCPYKYKTEAYRGQLSSAKFEVNCVAEQCPKWKDEYAIINNKTIQCSNFNCDAFTEPEYKSDLEIYVNRCLKCESHFGRCGG